MTIIESSASDRFIRQKNCLYRPGRIEQVQSEGHDNTWAIAYYVVGEDENYLLCNFYSGNSVPTLKINKKLILENK